MPESSRCDIRVFASRVILPSGELLLPGAVAITADRITIVRRNIEVEAKQDLDFPNAILLPGLVDLHAHPACDSQTIGIAPDSTLLPHGVTTVMSQGDAGAGNWEWYRDHTIAKSKTRVRIALNIGKLGEQAVGGSCANLNDVDADACINAIEQGDDAIWGIAANASRNACGDCDPREVVRHALIVAERTGKPLLYGPRQPEDWSFAEQFDQLRSGDVVTYLCRREPYSLVRDGRVLPVVREARERGVLFDAAHGMGSFSFPVAEAMIADGFLPDTISSDLYARDGVVGSNNLPAVMSMFAAAGMAQTDIFNAVTKRPAEILGLASDIGSIAHGMCADLTVLRWDDTPTTLFDVDGVERTGGTWQTLATIRAGKFVQSIDATHDNQASGGF